MKAGDKIKLKWPVQALGDDLLIVGGIVTVSFVKYIFVGIEQTEYMIKIEGYDHFFLISASCFEYVAATTTNKRIEPTMTAAKVESLDYVL